MIELPSFDHIKDPDAKALLELMKAMLQNQQSINEQLLTTNQQLLTKIDELTRLLQGPK